MSERAMGCCRPTTDLARCVTAVARPWWACIMPCATALLWSQFALAPLARAQTFRELPGRHLTLITDLAESPEVDALPAVFDQAVPLWCQYFGLEQQALADWRVTGYLMAEGRLFQQAGLVPDDLPPFLNGYARANRLWVFNQPTDYYRRHLLLHEGVHALMLSRWQGYGPPWYAEGMAELLATHQWAEGKLVLPVFPAGRESFSGWGRIKLVHEGLKRPDAPTFETLMGWPTAAFLENEAYGWAWAACAFLDGHPRWREAFRQMKQHVRLRRFNQHLQAAVGAAWPELVDEFSVFAHELEYGHDLEHWAMAFAPGEPLPEGGRTVRVEANRGWQSTAIRLLAGESYRLKATGRYQLASGPPPWLAEANGVSIRYYRRRPLGMLLAAVRRDQESEPAPSARDRHAGFLSPLPVGLEARIVPQHGGTLYLKINDSPAELGDNQGFLEVQIEHVAAQLQPPAP